MRPTFLKAISGCGHAARGRLSTKERLMRLTPHITPTQPPAVSLTAHNGRIPAGRWLMFSFAVVALALAGFTGTASAADVYLQAQSFNKSLTLPDSSMVTVPMWGFASCTDNTFATCAIDAPGPTVALSTTDSLTIHLKNILPVPVSIVIPGQPGGGDPEWMASDMRRVESFTKETATGATEIYTWSTLNPGTYLYQSGTQPSLQVPMGLYGALTVVDGGVGQAYPGISYEVDAVLLFSEIDPLQNQRVADAAVAAAAPAVADCDTLADFKQDPVVNNGYPCTIDYNPMFFLVNGAPTADNLPAGNGSATQDVLLRLLNAGLRSHTPSLVGIEMGLVAEDGNPYPGLIRQQSGALLPAGKTLDALVAMPADNITYALFDHLPTFSNESLPNNGGSSIATLQVGTGTPPPSAATIYTVNDTYAVPEDANPFTAVVSVLMNDVGLSSATATVTVVKDPLNGKITMNPDGTFSYTPNPDFSGFDGFTYSADDGMNKYPGQATLAVSFVNDAPMANADAYVNTIGPDITVEAPGVLGNDRDPDGDPLTAVTMLDVAPASGTVTLLADGSFTYTGGTPGTTVSFQYHVTDGTLLSTPPATVDLTVNPVANIALTVQEPGGLPVTSYRWLVQEDATYHIDPAAPGSTPLIDQLFLNFHKSSMPVVAQGCTDCDPDSVDIEHLALDPTKYYYVSVLPNDAGTGQGHTIGGAQILPGQTAVTVIVNKQEIPTAQISAFVFEDNSPTNGAPDANEPGLGGFTVGLEDAGGRYGISGGTMSQDAFGYPLANALDCFGGSPPPAGVILSCPDTPANQAAGLVGQVLIQNLPPGKYGVFAVAPSGGETWTQTSTIEGTKIIDAWVKAGEPPYFVEFGGPGPHAFIGFVNPAHTCLGPAPCPVDPGTPAPSEYTITGNVTLLHDPRPPAPPGTVDSGSYDGFAHTRAWVGLNTSTGDGPNVATVQADPDGSFTITGIPDGTYQLVVWDTYLDQIIAFQTATVNGSNLDVGNIGVNNWFTRQEHNVFLDDGCGDPQYAEDGIRQPCELGLPDQNVNVRWRDATVNQSYPTDTTGFVPFDQVFPFFSWQIAEIDYLRFKPTGVTVTVDAGGPVNNTNILNPQVQTADCTTPACLSRTEPGSTVLLEAFQGFPGQTSLFDWGKVPYKPGENGGIAGIVFYSSTRGEGDPRLTVGDPWEPGIAGVKVRLYREVARDPATVDVNVEPLDDFPGPGDTDHNSNGIFDGPTALALVEEVETDGWDTAVPTGCPGEDPADPFTTDTLLASGGAIDRCYDGWRNWNQVRPGVFDGGYAFNGIPPGKYVVEVVPPTGYEVYKEQDMNVTIGDAFGSVLGPAPVSTSLPNGMLVLVMPDQAMIEAAQGPEPGIAQPPCVGLYHQVPPELSLFPGEAAPFADAWRPYCNRKEVILSDQMQAAADFHLLTLTPIAAQFAGLITDDISNETNPASPGFGEKWSPAYLPFAIRDFNGNEVYSGLGDAFGRYNGVLPSTFTANVPIPSGYSPAMMYACLNDPGTGSALHLSNYNSPCYMSQFMPGTTTYLDTAIIPTAAFAAGFNPPDCAAPVGTPGIARVDGTGSGPLVAPGGTLVITSKGMTEVPNPDYEGPLATPPQNQPTIMRDYGFGNSTGSMTLSGIPITVDSWIDASISATVPATLPPGEYQLHVTRSTGETSIYAVTVTVGTETPTRVLAGGSIQTAIDNASAGDLILVEPGTYEEMVVMWKPVRLQGSGAGTIINAVNTPAEKLQNWITKVTDLFNNGVNGAVDPLPVQNFDLTTEQGGGITVLAKNDGSWNTTTRPRIDGFTITGAEGGGGIFVNGYAHHLEISNNNVTGNSGNLHGGVRIGQPFMELTGNGPFGFNTNVNIHDNAITLNGALHFESAGGGVSLSTGSDNYNVSRNLICGNYTAGDGAGIGHLGLSNNGRIEYNKLLFNQSVNNSFTQHGGGVFIAGEPGQPPALSLGAGDNLRVDGNLIQGNVAASGHGGGIRTQRVNGADVQQSSNPLNWNALTISNNMIVNNMAGWSGAGISLQDTVNAAIVLNTIANNDSTATVGAVFNVTTGMSTPQPAGISSELNNPGLNAVLPGVPPPSIFSNPTITHNIVWHNRAFWFDGTVLQPALSPATVGGCATGANYIDFGVLDPASSLDPQFNIITSTTGYNTNNSSADPQLQGEYCNGARSLQISGPILATGAIAEGGNFIDLRYGPLTQLLPTAYHLNGTSPAIDHPGLPPMGANVDHDFDYQRRPAGSATDWGADEVGGVALGGTVAFRSATNATLSGGTLNFGNIGGNGNRDSVVTIEVGYLPVNFGALSVSNSGGNGFSKLADTCSNQTVNSGSTCTVTIRFRYNGGGLKSGMLTVPHNGPGSPLTLNLSGR